MIAEPTILLTGASGQLGRDLRGALSNLGRVVAVDRTACTDEPAPTLDFGDLDAVRALLRREQPAIVVNAAAFTAVDRAEDEPELAMRVNAEAPRVMAEEIAAYSGVLIQYSTDYVFSGRSSVAYREDDAVDPVNAYGASKAKGEEQITRVGGHHFILRTTWLYSASGRNFVRAVLERWRRGEPLRIVDDQTGCPTWTRPLAAATAELVAQCRDRDARWLRAHSGVYHLCAGGSCTWYELAMRLFTLMGEADPGARITPVATGEFPTRARRPPYSVLDCAKAREKLGIELAPWDRQLEQFVHDAHLDAPGAAGGP